jgi:hypothetical protein
MESFNFRDGSYKKFLSIIERTVQKKIEDKGLCAYRVLLVDGDQVNGKAMPYIREIINSHYVGIAASSTPQKLDGFKMWADLTIQADNKKDSSDMYIELAFQHLVQDPKCIGVDIITVDQALVQWLKGFAAICEVNWRVHPFTSWDEWKKKVGDINIAMVVKMPPDQQKKQMIERITAKKDTSAEEVWQHRDISDAFALLKMVDSSVRNNKFRITPQMMNPEINSVTAKRLMVKKEELSTPLKIEDVDSSVDVTQKLITGVHMLNIVGNHSGVPRIGLVKEEGHKLFGLPGGKPNRGESKMETMIREFKEETGNTYVPTGLEEWDMSPGISDDCTTIYHCHFMRNSAVWKDVWYFDLTSENLKRAGVEPYVFRVLNHCHLLDPK